MKKKIIAALALVMVAGPAVANSHFLPEGKGKGTGEYARSMLCDWFIWVPICHR